MPIALLLRHRQKCQAKSKYITSWESFLRLACYPSLIFPLQFVQFPFLLLALSPCAVLFINLIYSYHSRGFLTVISFSLKKNQALFFCWHCYTRSMIICPCLLGARHGYQNKNLPSEGPKSKAEIYLEVCRASNC